MKNIIGLMIAAMFLLPLAAFGHDIVPSVGIPQVNGNSVSLSITAHDHDTLKYIQLIFVEGSSLKGQRLTHLCAGLVDCTASFNFNEGNAGAILYNLEIVDFNNNVITHTVQLPTTTPSTGGSSGIQSSYTPSTNPTYTPTQGQTYSAPSSTSDYTPSLRFDYLPPSTIGAGQSFSVQVTSGTNHPLGVNRIILRYPSNSINANKEYILNCGGANPCTKTFEITEQKQGIYTYHIETFTKTDQSSTTPFTVNVGNAQAPSGAGGTQPYTVGDGVCSSNVGETTANSPNDCKVGGGAPAPVTTPQPGSTTPQSSIGGSGATRDATATVRIVDVRGNPVTAKSVCWDSFCVSNVNTYAFNTRAGVGTLTIDAQDQGYMLYKNPITVVYDQNQNITATLLKPGESIATNEGTFVDQNSPLSPVTITVTDLTGAVENAAVTVTATGFAPMSKFTDSKGQAIMDLRSGCYEIVATKGTKTRSDRICVPEQSNFKMSLSGLGISGLAIGGWALWGVVAVAIIITAFLLLSQMGYIGYGITGKSLDSEEKTAKTPLIHDLDFNGEIKPREEKRTDFFS